jgi:hypothetical protein
MFGQEVWCPQGKRAVSWTESTDHAKKPCVSVQFSRKDCTACPTRAACTLAQHRARSLQLSPREHYEALQAMRAWYASAEGKRQYARRAGIEGTLSKGCGPSGCGGHAIGASRRRTCSTSRRPPRSTSTARSPGSTSAHEPPPGPPASPRWRLPAACLRRPLRSERPCDLRPRVPVSVHTPQSYFLLQQLLIRT